MECRDCELLLDWHFSKGESGKVPDDVLDHLKECPECSRIYSEIESFWQTIEGWEPSETSEKRRRDILNLAKKQRPGKQFRYFKWAAAVLLAACISAVIIFLITGTVPASTCHVLSVEGYVRNKVEGKLGNALPVTAGQEFKPGSELYIGPDGLLELKFIDESILTIYPNSEIALLKPEPGNRDFAFLKRGAVVADVAKGKGRFILKLKENQVTALGTRFYVTCRYDWETFDREQIKRRITR